MHSPTSLVVARRCTVDSMRGVQQGARAHFDEGVRCVCIRMPAMTMLCTWRVGGQMGVGPPSPTQPPFTLLVRTTFLCRRDMHGSALGPSVRTNLGGGFLAYRSPDPRCPAEPEVHDIMDSSGTPPASELGEDASLTGSTVSQRGGNMHGRALSRSMVRAVMEYVVYNPEQFQPMARASFAKPMHAWLALVHMLRSKLEIVRRARESGERSDDFEVQSWAWVWEERDHPVMTLGEEAAAAQLKTKVRNEKQKLKVRK